MSRTKSLIISLSVLVLGYLVSYFYAVTVLESNYVFGIHQQFFYLFYIPLLYFMVLLLFGKPAFGKYKDAFGVFILALLRILSEYLVNGHLVISDFIYTFLGFISLLVMLRFFYIDNEKANDVQNEIDKKA